MAEAVISDEINRHVEAVLVLSRRDVLLRLLREAQLCVELGQLATAAILAGIALEEAFLLTDPTSLRKYDQNLEAWRELRNRAAHTTGAGQEMEPESVAAMITGIRRLLGEIDISHNLPKQSPRPGNEFAEILGKYAFVPTSVDDFLKRKREDLELEGRV